MKDCKLYFLIIAFSAFEKGGNTHFMQTTQMFSDDIVVALLSFYSYQVFLDVTGI